RRWFKPGEFTYKLKIDLTHLKRHSACHGNHDNTYILITTVKHSEESTYMCLVSITTNLSRNMLSDMCPKFVEMETVCNMLRRNGN
ncbi:hypothetical protein L9F63_008096, partial [Diploptera punctata]